MRMSSSGSKRPSPARSLGSLQSRPRRSLRRSSVSDAGGRLSSNSTSLLTDNTDIDAPRRKSWWKNLDRPSINIQEIFGDKPTDNEDFNIENVVEIENRPGSSRTRKRNINLDDLDLTPASSSSGKTKSHTSEKSAKKKVDDGQKTEMHNTSKTRSSHRLKKNITIDSDDTKILEESIKINAQRRPLFGKKSVKVAEFPFPKNESRKQITNITNVTSKTIDASIEINYERKDRFPKKQTKQQAFPVSIMSESDEESIHIQKKLGALKKDVQMKAVSRRASTISRSSKRALSPDSFHSETLEIENWKLLPSSTMIVSTPAKKLRRGEAVNESDERLSVPNNVKDVEFQAEDEKVVSNEEQTSKVIEEIEENMVLSIDRDDVVGNEVGNEISQKSNKNENINKKDDTQRTEIEQLNEENRQLQTITEENETNQLNKDASQQPQKNITERLSQSNKTLKNSSKIDAITKQDHDRESEGDELKNQQSSKIEIHPNQNEDSKNGESEEDGDILESDKEENMGDNEESDEKTEDEEKHDNEAEIAVSENEDILESENEESAVESEKEESVAESEKEESVAESEKEESVAESEKEDTLAESEKEESVTESEKEECVAESEKEESMAESEKEDNMAERRNLNDENEQSDHIKKSNQSPDDGQEMDQSLQNKDENQKNRVEKDNENNVDDVCLKYDENEQDNISQYEKTTNHFEKEYRNKSGIHEQTEDNLQRLDNNGKENRSGKENGNQEENEQGSSSKHKIQINHSTNTEKEMKNESGEDKEIEKRSEKTGNEEGNKIYQNDQVIENESEQEEEQQSEQEIESEKEEENQSEQEEGNESEEEQGDESEQEHENESVQDQENEKEHENDSDHCENDEQSEVSLDNGENIDENESEREDEQGQSKNDEQSLESEQEDPENQTDQKDDNDSDQKDETEQIDDVDQNNSLEYDENSEHEEEIEQNDNSERGNDSSTQQNNEGDREITHENEITRNNESNVATQKQSFQYKGRPSEFEILRNATANQSAYISKEIRSSSEGSGWNSHTTAYLQRKSSMYARKSLRTMVLDKARPSTNQVDDFMDVDDHEFTRPSLPIRESVLSSPARSPGDSPRTAQTKLSKYFKKITDENMERQLKIEEKVKKSIKKPENNPNFERTFFESKEDRKNSKNAKNEAKNKKRTLKQNNNQLDVVLDGKVYKPPKLYKPPRAPWITARLYKYLDSSLRERYGNETRNQSERLVHLLFEIHKHCLKRNTDVRLSVQTLKRKLALMGVVSTHYQYYQFVENFMPMEFRMKTIPDIVNGLPVGDLYENIIPHHTSR